MTAALDVVRAEPSAVPEGSVLRRRADRRRRRLTSGVAVALVLAVALPLALVLGSPPEGRTALVDDPVLTDPVAPDAAPNPTVYGRTVEASATVVGPLAEAISVSTAAADALGVLGAHTLIVTPVVDVHLRLPSVARGDLEPVTALWLDGTEVVSETEVAALPAGRPTLVMVPAQHRLYPDDPVPLDPADPLATEPGVLPALPDPVLVRLEATDANGQTAEVQVRLVPTEQTGDDLGIPGPTDIPDQRLPRPAVGEALPERLADGRPVWVVGLDDDAVAVVDARSPHTVSGLVGWCGRMHGFEDSIGASRYTAEGGYAFGPAPHGLMRYAVEVEVDHVTVTETLPAEPRPGLFGWEQRIPPIEGSPTPQQGACNGEVTDQPYREDYRHNPDWVQHDLSAWPVFDEQADGWYVTDRAPLPEDQDSFQRIDRVGQVLVQRVDGRTVDVASPPGVSHIEPRPGIPPDPPSLQLLIAINAGGTPECPIDLCPHGSVDILAVTWLTPSAATDVTTDEPPAGAVLSPRPWLPGGSPENRSLAPDATVDAAPGDLVEVVLDDEGYRAVAIRAHSP